MLETEEVEEIKCLWLQGDFAPMDPPDVVLQDAPATHFLKKTFCFKYLCLMNIKLAVYEKQST